MKPYIDWVGKAEAAEAALDWDEAKRCWYYAARECRDGDRAASYCEREDAAERMRRKALS